MSYLLNPVTDHRYWQRLFGLSTVVILLLSLLLLITSPQRWIKGVLAETTGTTYYVATTGSDSNPGTESQPLGTIQKAIRLAKAGDTIQVRGGTYHESLRIANSGTAGQPITIMAYPGETPILDGEYVLPTGSVARCNDTVSPPKCFTFNALVRIIGSHIHVRGFNLTRSYGRGITIGNTANKPTTNVVVEDCTIHDVRNNQIQVRFAEDILVQNCVLYHGSDYATHDRSTSELNWPSMLIALDAERVTFRGNTAYNNWGAGITAGAGSSDVIIEQNVIYDNMGLQSYIHRTRNVIVRDNLMYHTNDADFWRGGDISGCIGLNNEKDFADAHHVQGIEIYNNILVGCQKNIAFWSSDGTNTLIEDVHIHHNTLVNAASNKTRTAVNFSITCNASIKNITLEKNIILQQNAVAGKNPCLSGQAAEAAGAGGAVVQNSLEQYIGQAPAGNQVTYISNLWWTTQPPGMDDDGDLVADPQLANANAPLTPGGVERTSYLPRPSSPALQGGQGARAIGEGGSAPLPTPTPTTPATPQPTPVSCLPAVENLITNAGFETGQTPWKFHTNGRGNYSATAPGFECDKAAQLQIKKQGRNVQFFQKRVQLQAGTQYRLSFYAYSNTGNDLKVYLEKNGGNRANYGVKAMRADLTGEWRMFTTEFTATGFNGTAKNVRLRFWLAPYDEDGDEYWIDHVIIEPVGNGRSAAPAAPNVEMVQLVEEPDEAVGGGTVSGTIQLKAANGAAVPVEEVEVILAHEESEGFDFEAVVETDETGYYLISGVPAGEHLLTIIPPTGYSAAAAESIHVEGEESIERNYTLDEAAGVIYLPLVANE